MKHFPDFASVSRSEILSWKCKNLSWKCKNLQESGIWMIDILINWKGIYVTAFTIVKECTMSCTAYSPGWSRLFCPKNQIIWELKLAQYKMYTKTLAQGTNFGSGTTGLDHPGVHRKLKSAYMISCTVSSLKLYVHYKIICIYQIHAALSLLKCIT